MKKKHESDGPGIPSRSVFKILRVMKLMMVLICFVGLLSSFGKSYSQNTKLSVEFKSSTIESVLNYIESRTDYSFMYDNKKIDVSRVVNISAKDKTVEAILDQLFENGVTYKMLGKHIIITPKGSDFSTTLQQSHSVSGRVTDSSGASLPGVTVRIKGTNNGTITDTDGSYTLTGVPANTTLIFSFVGMKSQEVGVGEKKTINVTLVEETVGIEEVVAVGYGSQRRKEITNSIKSISESDLLKGISSSSIATAMQGKIGGLVITGNASPNSGNDFQLRGMTSINAGKSPLIVIDGFPGGDIRSLEQNDIKSINVLKDASAGAIYGTRAASGVILITTKRGTNTEGKINVSYIGETSKKQAYPNLELLSAAEYVQHNRGIDYGSDINWYNEFLNTSNFSQKHNLTIEVGNKNSQLYTSFTYDDNQGVAINDSREDYSGRVNAHFNLFEDWLEINPNLSYKKASRNNNYPDFSQALINNPTRSPYDKTSSSGYNVWTDNSFQYNSLADSKLSDYNGIDTWFRPEVLFKLNIKPIQGLSMQQTIGYENREWEYHYYRSKYHRTEVSNSRSGYAHLEFNKTETLNSEGYMTYLNQVGKNFINAVAGYSYFERNNDGFSMGNYNFTYDQTKYWNIGEGTYLRSGLAEMSSTKAITERLFSIFGRVNYSYFDKYNLSATIRREGSSKFGPSNRWGTFWSISGGWDVSHEYFMKSTKWINNLKIRVGYGVTGNNNFSSSYTANLLQSYTPWLMPDGSWRNLYGPSGDVNENLGWEVKKELNLGMDYFLFKNRLWGNFDIYKRKIEGMIYAVDVPQPPYVSTSQYRNIGNMENRGWEFEVGGLLVNSKDLVYKTELNLSHNKTKILSLWGDATYYLGSGFRSPGAPGDAARIEAGSSVGSFYLWKFAGFDDNGNFLLYDKDDNIIPAANKTLADKRYLGNYMPKLMVGWNHHLQYKKWSLDMSLRSWLDFDVYNTTAMYFGIQNTLDWNLLRSAYGKYKDIRGEKQLCNFYLEDGSFLKIDAITLGYDLKFKSGIIKKLNIYSTIGNVVTFTKYSGYNPEINITGWTGGIDWYGGYPQTRIYTLGIKANF